MNETKTQLEIASQALEAELLKDPAFAHVVMAIKADQERKRAEDERREILKSVAEVIKASADRYASIESQNSEGLDGLKTAIAERLDSVLKALNKPKADDTVKAVKELEKAIVKLATRKVETLVEVKAPEPIVETKIIQETKEIGEVATLMRDLIAAIKDQNKGLEKIAQRSLILNNKPGDAIPVQIVDKKGQRFQDMSDVKTSASSTMVPTGGFMGVGGGGGQPFNQFTENASVATSVETDIVSYTVPGSIPAYVGGALVSCGAAVKFKIKVNGAVVSVGRTSPSHPTENLIFGNGPIKVSAGDVVKVTAYHEEGSNQIVDANLYGNF